MADLGGPVARRIYVLEGLLTTGYSLPPWAPPGTPTAPASYRATAGFATASRGFAPTSEGLGSYDLRLATEDYTTAASDADKPSAWWDGRLLNPGHITKSIPLTPTGEGAVESATGTITVDNTDGYFDVLLDTYQAVSQHVAIKQADLGQAWAAFDTLWEMRITGLGITERELTLEVQDTLTAYSDILYPSTAYTGLGGSTGDASLAGALLPVLLGRVWNITPVLVNATTRIYQIHDGAVAAISGVFDGGVALTAGANHATYDLLAAATVTAGTYQTCLALGFFRLGSDPAKGVTVHADGHSAAGITTRSLATWLATQLEPQIWVDIDTAAFATLPARNAGWYWTEPFSYREALDRFIGDTGYFWGAVKTGPVTVGKLDPPVEASSVATYDMADIISLERVSLPSGYESTHARRLVRYRRNWTIQGITELAGAAVEKPARGVEWKQVSASSATVARNATEPPILDTSLALAADAQSLANALIALHGARRRMFSLVLRAQGLLPSLADTIIVIYPRYGLDGGVAFRVVSLEIDFGAGEMTMLLWG